MKNPLIISILLLGMQKLHQKYGVLKYPIIKDIYKQCGITKEKNGTQIENFFFLFKKSFSYLAFIVEICM